MQRFRSILLLYQGWLGDEATLDRGISLARDNGADLTLARIADTSREPRRNILPLPPPDSAAVEKDLAKETFAQLQRVAAGIPAGNFRIHCRVLPRDETARAIRRLIVKERFDLLMMTADYASLLGALVFGSLAIDCMRRAPCPIWVSPPHRNGETGSIVAAVNPKGSNADLSSLDLDILETAAALARQRNRRLDIVHAWELEGADLETSRSEINDQIRKRLVGRATSRCANAVAELCAATDLERLETEIHLARGTPAEVVARFASENEVELVVMGGASRTGLGAVLFRNPAEKLVESASASILALKAPAPRAVRVDSTYAPTVRPA